MKAIILAGGKGVRLRPFTYIIPKPLMPIGEVPILNILINQLTKAGFKDIIISTGYKKELIEIFLRELEKNKHIHITYSYEKKPLGTIGPLSMLKGKVKEDFLLMNGDTLSNIDYADFMNYHKKSGNIATIGVYKKNIYIDFGVLKLENDKIVDYLEKPNYSYPVSMGIYAFKPEILKHVPSKHFDFPELIKLLIKKGEKIGVYHFDGYWMDIGRTEDFIEVNNTLEDVYKKLGIKKEECL
jgi:NDP-mannose synthase